MRPRRTSSEHQAAVARRLAQLSAELEATRSEGVAPAAGGEWWSDHTRVASVSPDLRVVPAPRMTASAATPVDEPPLVPLPGRHAARRGTRLAGSLVPATLRGRVALGPGAVAVVALVVAAGLAITAWLVVRGDPEQPTVAVTAPASGDELVSLDSQAPSAGLSTGPAPAAGQSAAGQVTVDVTGKVRSPGIAVLDAGSRVVDAIEAAGGARPRVDLSSLNLARVLVDGEQIVVGVEAPAPVVLPSTAVSGAPPGQLVSLNAASAAELETLPEVGPVTAAAIIAWRDTNGGFTSIDELLEIDGIGEATLGQIAPYVTV